MSRIVILGAGELGGALAYTLARRDRVREIRLIDPAGDVAAGKALDIRQSGPVEGFDAQITASSDISHVVSADMIVVADPVAGAAEAGEEWSAGLLRRIAPLVPRIAVIAAGAAHADLVGLNAREALLPRLRLLGSAPEALAAAARTMVALEMNASPDDVALSVAGLPPSGFIVGWSEATIGGAAIERVLPPPALRRLAARVARVWPPGPAALASAAARVVETMVTGSRRQATCFVALDGELGQRVGVSALPVRLGARGVESVGTPALSAGERTLLENVLGMS
jgi:malate dehydrogenase